MKVVRITVATCNRFGALNTPPPPKSDKPKLLRAPALLSPVSTGRKVASVATPIVNAAGSSLSKSYDFLSVPQNRCKSLDSPRKIAHLPRKQLTVRFKEENLQEEGPTRRCSIFALIFTIALSCLLYRHNQHQQDAALHELEPNNSLNLSRNEQCSQIAQFYKEHPPKKGA